MSRAIPLEGLACGGAAAHRPPQRGKGAVMVDATIELARDAAVAAEAS
jgi:hypothetical protein